MKKAVAFCVAVLGISILSGATPFLIAHAAALNCNFTRPLYQGISGNDVFCLERYLNLGGFFIALTGPGSPGNETNYFSPLVKTAVTNWQIANNISPASGYFGPISKKVYATTLADVPSSYINKEYPSGVSTPYTITWNGKNYTVNTVPTSGEKSGQVRVVVDDQGKPVTDFGRVLQIMKVAWANEQIISIPAYAAHDLTTRGWTLQQVIDEYDLLKIWEASMDVIERTGINAAVAFASGGTSLVAGTADSMKSAFEDVAFDPKVYAALYAQSQLKKAISAYNNIVMVMPSAKSGQTINGAQAIQIRDWYLQAHPLDLEYSAVLSLLTNKNFQDEMDKFKSTAEDEVKGLLPTSSAFEWASAINDLNNKITDLAASFSPEIPGVTQAAYEKPIDDNTVNAWTSMAVMLNANAHMQSSAATATPAPQTQSTMQPSVGLNASPAPFANPSGSAPTNAASPAELLSFHPKARSFLSAPFCSRCVNRKAHFNSTD